MKCIEDIFYLLFSAESDQKKSVCIFSCECPFNSQSVLRVLFAIMIVHISMYSCIYGYDAHVLVMSTPKNIKSRKQEQSL